MTDQPPQDQQPPPSYQPTPYNPYAGYQAPPPYNTYAILSLVLAVLVLPPLGIYFGHLAKKQIAQTGERGIELANAAVIVGWVLSGIIAVGFILWCAVFGSMMFGFFSFFGTASTFPR